MSIRILSSIEINLMQNEIVDLYNGVQWTAYTKEISKPHAGDSQFTFGDRLLCG